MYLTASEIRVHRSSEIDVACPAHGKIGFYYLQHISQKAADASWITLHTERVDWTAEPENGRQD